LTKLNVGHTNINNNLQCLTKTNSHIKQLIVPTKTQSNNLMKLNISCSYSNNA